MNSPPVYFTGLPPFPASKCCSALGLRFLLSLPWQSPLLVAPYTIFRMMTSKFLSHFSSEVQSPIPTWVFNRYCRPPMPKAEFFIPCSLWPKLLLPQSSLFHGYSIFLIPQCKTLKLIFFLPSLSYDAPSLSASSVNSTIKSYCTSKHFLPFASSSPTIISSHLDSKSSLLITQPQSVSYTATEEIFSKHNRKILFP